MREGWNERGRERESEGGNERGRELGREGAPHLFGDNERNGSSMVNDGLLESDLLLERERRVQVQRDLDS